MGSALSDRTLLAQSLEKRAEFAAEMESLRFGLKPSAVYFNPTDRCNLNCTYCYLPEESRKNRPAHVGGGSSRRDFAASRTTSGPERPEVEYPQVIFHGAEPMLNREAVFAAIDEFKDDFSFGLQTNGTLLDEEAIAFLTTREVSIGLSLDGASGEVADRLRVTWAGGGVSDKVVSAMARLKGYANYSVICTVTTENMHSLPEVVEYFHAQEVPYCLLNPVRCTRPGARTARPADHELAENYLKALDRTYELYQETGRKLVVANFANVLIGVVAPTARRLMCDISPCGGGRCFFAVSANGDLYPCSEFIGLPEFKGGNLFEDKIASVLETSAFRSVTERKIEDDRAVRTVRDPALLRIPLPGRGARHERRGGNPRRVLRTLRGAGALCPASDRGRQRRGLSLGGVGRRHGDHHEYHGAHLSPSPRSARPPHPFRARRGGATTGRAGIHTTPRVHVDSLPPTPYNTPSRAPRSHGLPRAKESKSARSKRQDYDCCAAGYRLRRR